MTEINYEALIIDLLGFIRRQCTEDTYWFLTTYIKNKHGVDLDKFVRLDEVTE